MPDDIARQILEQELGTQEEGKPRGWPAWRYHLGPDEQPRLSQTDYLRSLDAKVCSELPAHGDAANARPKPPEIPDDLFGHVLSARAELVQTREMLIAIGDALETGDTAGLGERLRSIGLDRR